MSKYTKHIPPLQEHRKDLCHRAKEARERGDAEAVHNLSVAAATTSAIISMLEKAER